MAEIYAWDKATDWSWSLLSVQLVPFQFHVQKSGFPPFFHQGFFPDQFRRATVVVHLER